MLKIKPPAIQLAVSKISLAGVTFYINKQQGIMNGVSGCPNRLTVMLKSGRKFEFCSSAHPAVSEMSQHKFYVRGFKDNKDTLMMKTSLEKFEILVEAIEILNKDTEVEVMIDA
jgi:hypothetical protein